MPYPDSEDDIELSRQERLRDLRASSKTPRSGDGSRLEAIRIAASLMQSVDDGLAGNSAIVTDPELYRLAYRAFENLFELHRALGGAHPPAEAAPDNASRPAVPRPAKPVR